MRPPLKLRSLAPTKRYLKAGALPLPNPNASGTPTPSMHASRIWLWAWSSSVSDNTAFNTHGQAQHAPSSGGQLGQICMPAAGGKSQNQVFLTYASRCGPLKTRCVGHMLESTTRHYLNQGPQKSAFISCFLDYACHCLSRAFPVRQGGLSCAYEKSTPQHSNHPTSTSRPYPL